MYTENYERKGFPIRDFLLKLLLIIIFVVLLCWLLPKFISPKITNYNSSKNSGTSVNSISTSELSGISSQIFSDNLNKMKEAATSYFTESRLPSEVGQSVKLTLKDMMDEKLLISLVDKNGNKCDVEKSYVKVTKLDDEYLMKVNLSCSEKEDYILVHMGCYNYCNSYICAKNESSYGYENYTKGSKETSLVSFYGEGTKNGKTNYYYYGTSNGTNTYKAATTGTTNQSSSTTNYIYYITNITNNTTKENNTSSAGGSVVNNITNNIINIIVNNCSTNNTCPKPDPVDPTPEPTPGPSTEYLYEYSKTTNATFSKWSDWSAWSKTSCDTKEINCNTADPTCLNKLQLYKRREQVGTYQKAYTTSHQALVQLASYNQKACSNFNYVIIDNITYATTASTTTTYSRVNTITNQTVTSTGGWVYNGRSSYNKPPRDTAGTHYKWVGADYNSANCGETCTTLPNWYYDSYTYTGGLTKVSSTTTPGNVTSTSTTSTNTTSTTSSNVQVSCGSYVNKTIPVYGYVTQYEKAYRTENLYGDVCYKSTKSRTKLTDGKTETKWSTYNDSSLLNNGWTYTGKKRVK